MSWQEKRKNEYVINTGDGERYVPKAFEFSFQTEYNIATFEFIQVSGTFVAKSKPMGKKYPFKIYFDDTADDHLETIKKFVKSCDDRRPWTIEHPIYDYLVVQVASLDFGDNAKNITEVSGVFLETIEENKTLLFNPGDQIIVQFEETIITLQDALGINEPFSSADINQLDQDNINTYKSGVPVIILTEDFETYFNAFNVASSYINTATATPLLMMNSVMNVITAPALFQISAQARIDLMLKTLSDLRANIIGFTTVKAKQLFQIKSGAALSALCLSAATPLISDYKNITPILGIIENISNNRERFINDLDSLQTPNGGNTNSFIPDAEALISLNRLVNNTIASLYNISLSARSERSIICDKDTNIILLAHKLYGLDINDTNINDLYDSNDLTENEHLIIEKGRKIFYYF